MHGINTKKVHIDMHKPTLYIVTSVYAGRRGLK